MNFIKTVISGLWEVLDSYGGRGTVDFRTWMIGFVAFVLIFATFFLFLSLFDKTKLSGKKSFVFSIFATILLLLIVGVCAIAIEKIW